MSGINIPQDSRSIDKLLPHTQPEEQITSAGPHKDSLEKFTSYNLGLETTQSVNEAPQLPHPKVSTEPIAMFKYFKTIHSASLAFRHQLSASDLVDQESRRLRARATLSQAEVLEKLLKDRQEALVRIEKEAKEIIEDIQKQLDTLQDMHQQQQKRIDQINQGNALEQQKYAELSQAYDTYIKDLKSIGAIEQADGSFFIPEESVGTASLLKHTYTQAVQSFNSYQQERQTQLKHYNEATLAYNQTLAQHNKNVHDLINKYSLEEALQAAGIIIPYLVDAPLYNFSHRVETIQSPISGPQVISIPFLPSYVKALGTSGPSSLPSLKPFLPIVNLHTTIYQNLQVTQISYYDQKILASHTYWMFLSHKAMIPIQDTIPDPLLNTKRLALKILPAAYIESSMPIKPTSTGMGSLALQAVGLNNSHLADILGRALLTQAFDNLHIQLFEGFEEQAQEKKIQELVDHILLISVGLLGNQSLQALLPSFSPISSSLETLPLDSPAFAILFAVSFANRVQEDAQQGMTAETLQTFFNNNPDLAALSDEDKSQLVAIVNLGHLLIAAKLLESNLGLPGLLAHLLPSLLPSSVDSSSLLTQAAQEGRQNLEYLKTHLETHLIEQNYPPETAQFLAQIGAQLTERGLLTPTTTSPNAPHKFDQPLLIDSLKAALVLVDYPLIEADFIAHEAVENALAEGPFHSTQQLRTALEFQLQALGLRDKSPDIVLQTIVIPPPEEALAVLPSISTLLSPPELIPILEKRSLQLLTPQLGAPLAKQVTQELTKTLLGTFDLEKPFSYSLVQVMKNQLDQLKLDKEQEWADQVVDAFKDTIKTMEDFYAFSLKLMDPAYLFVYSAQTGIIYGDHNKHKPIDILI